MYKRRAASEHNDQSQLRLSSAQEICPDFRKMPIIKALNSTV